MTFREDVRRWTVRKLRELYARSGIKTADDVRRLIEYPWIGPYYTVDNRPPIPGAVGVGTRPSVTPIETPQILLEHGVLIFAQGSNQVPPTQHNTLELGIYLGSVGTLIPDTALLQYLIGEAMISGNPCVAGPDRYNWPANSTAYVNNYPSMVYFAQSVFDELTGDPYRRTPNLWSGLTLLLCQNLVGSGKQFQDLMSPYGWTPNPNEQGLLRLWDADNSAYRWFLARANATVGVQAIELLPTAEGACPHAWLNAHGAGAITLDADDLRYFESWAMRSFVSVGNAIQILTPAEIAEVYENGAAPVVYGWATSQQLLGDADSEALIAMAITTLWEEQVQPGEALHHAKTFQLSFSLTSGNLGALLTTVSSGDAHFENTVAPLWYPPQDDAGLELFYSQVNDPGTSTDFCPAYCWFRRSSLVELEYIKHFASTGESRQFLWEDTYHCVDVEKGWLGICADELGTIWRYGERVRDRSGGGWRIADVTADQTWGAGGAPNWRQTKTFAIVQLYGARECCRDQFANANPSVEDCMGSNAEWCGGTAEAERDALCANKHACDIRNYRLKGGESEIWQYTDAYDLGSWGGKGAIIARDHREAVYICEGFHFENHRRSTLVKERAWPDFTPQCPGGGCGQFSLGHNEFQFQYDITDNPGEDTYQVWGDWHSYGVGSCDGGDQQCGVVTPWQDRGTANIPEDEMQAWLIARDETYELIGDWAAWNSLITASQGESRAWNPYVVGSYFENAGWYFEKPDTPLVVGNLPGDPSADSYIVSGAV